MRLGNVDNVQHREIVMRRTGSICAVIMVGVALSVSSCGAADDESQERSGGLVEATPEGVSPEDGCQKVDAWLEANRTALPSTFRDVVRFPVQYRKAIISSHSPGMRSALWRERFEVYARRRPSLTPAQQAVVERAIVFASPELFSIDRDSPNWNEAVDAPLRELMNDAEVAFGFEEARALLAIFGPLDLVAADQIFAPVAGNFVAANANRVAECPCSTQSDYCSYPYHCTYQYPRPCTKLSFGCGSLLLYECNGWCS
ncbi:bacteriocin fulvocin C-related protein [Sorangium sp. So ce1036]|uniref:bacteriocin fulvocin C-related protein n=1 Tax=Sorangium sp. So ce1036 TaxID=3133328 RepID=UPI003F01E2C6